MDRPLFRPEVLEAKRSGWLGAISLAQPLRLWVLGSCLAGAALAAGLFLALGEYTRRSRVAGQLVPDLGVSTVVAPRAGIVERIYPSEGERVLRGTPLALVTAPSATEHVADARMSMAAGVERRRAGIRANARSQEELLARREEGLRAQLAAMAGEVVKIRDQLASRTDQVALARETLERYRSLRRQRYVSALQVAQQQQAVLELVAGQQGLERQLATMRRERSQLEQALAEIPAQRAAQEAATARELALLDREKVQNEVGSERLVEAPVSGLVANCLVEPGQAVQPGQPLLSLLPAGSRLQAQLFVPSRAIGFIDPGDKVLLRYQAFPYQKFGHHEGVVRRVSRSAVPPPDGAAGEPYYRVLVDIDHQAIAAYGRDEPLRPGMMLEADIMGEHRKLYEWILEPLYSITGKIQSDQDST